MPPIKDPSKAFEALFTSEKGAFLRLLGETGTGADLEKYDLYFLHLKKTCKKMNQKELDTMRAKNDQEVLKCMEELLKIENVGNCKRSYLRKTLRDKFYPKEVEGAAAPADSPVIDEKIDNTIHFILRIFLTINVREKEFATGPSITWTEAADGTESTLAKFVEGLFPELKKEDSKPDQDREVAFDRKFSAAALWDKRGVKTLITYDLRNHLYYDSNNKQLSIYPLRRWLELHKARYVKSTCQKNINLTISSNKSIVPKRVIDETLNSLALLFPVGQPKANKEYLKSILYDGNLEKEGHDYPFDPPLEPLNPNIRLDDFHIWQDRLAKVYFIFIGPPTSELQRFREDFKSWFGFWGAVVAIVLLTFVFGVLAITFAILAWNDANKGTDELLDVIKELLDVVKSAADARTVATVTVTAVRF